MQPFFKGFFSRGALAIVAIAAALALAFGSVLLAVVGVAIAALVGAAPQRSGRKRRLRRAASAAGYRDDETLQALEALADALRRLRSSPSAGQPAFRACDQLEQANGAFLAFGRVLGDRFSPAELAHGRYQKAGAQVYLSVLDGLNRASTSLATLDTLDVDDLKARLRQLKRRDDPSQSERSQLDALEERLRVFQEELGEVESVLSSNEEGLTQLATASAALARTGTNRGLADTGAETAMADLERLAERATAYARPKSR